MSYVEELYKKLMSQKKSVLKLITDIATIVTTYNLEEVNRLYYLEFHVGTCGNMVELDVLDRDLSNIVHIEYYGLERVFRDDMFLSNVEESNLRCVELVSKLTNMKQVAATYVSMNNTKKLK